MFVVVNTNIFSIIHVKITPAHDKTKLFNKKNKNIKKKTIKRNKIKKKNKKSFSI